MATIRQANLRSIALPTEHGGWGLVLEPVLLGLLVAPSGWGVLLGLAVFCLFLAHQPLKLVAKDYLKHRRITRTAWAERFALLYSATGLGLVLLIVAFNDANYLLPVFVGSAFALVQFAYDIRHDSRALIPELCGAIALAASASSMALLAGWQMLPALMLWLLLAVRAVTAIVYVRARLRMVYGKPHNTALVYAAHWLALLGLVLLALSRYIPMSSVVALLILLLRAYLGLTSKQNGIAPKVIGFREMGYGLLYVLLVAVGYWLMLL